MPGGSKHRRRSFAAIAVISQPTIQKAADVAGISKPTLERWMTEPEFAAEVERNRSEAIARAKASLEDAMVESIEKLREIINKPTVRDSDCVSAIRTLGDWHYNMKAKDRLDAALDALQWQPDF